jgi:deoxyribodipyrimidine photo-lyase
MATPMPASSSPVIHWYRRDLRIADNLSLHHAASMGRPVIPIYFLSDWKKSHLWTGPKRQHFLCGCLASLAKNLETIDGRLIIRHGNAVKGLRQVIKESGAKDLCFNSDPDPFGKAVEEKIRQLCAELDVRCHAFHDHALHTPDEVLTQSELPYKVYTPYSRNWLALEKPSPVGKPKKLSTPAGIKSLPLPTLAHWGLKEPDAQLPEPGERAARERFKKALGGIVQHYGNTRDIPSLQGTSRISQDLRFGLISIRTIHAELMKSRAAAKASERASIDIYHKELAWREFYFAILHHFPNVLEEEFNREWRGLPWDAPNENFDAWKTGRTGFPIIDAGMRELLATGFMHNRVRMITAMFLTKDLHVDWRLGESYFMQHLLDGEIASNNGGWQWSAGTGADAAPYFRIQNPWSQTARYDPQGIYIKRWVPELAAVDPKKFLEPPADGNPLAPGYPLPCVDHKSERDRTLAIFKRHRENR